MQGGAVFKAERHVRSVHMPHFRCQRIVQPALFANAGNCGMILVSGGGVVSSREDKGRKKATTLFRKLAPGKFDRIGEENIDRFIELFSSFEEIRGTYGLTEMFGPRYGVFFAISLVLVSLLGWLFHFPGFLSGIILSVAFGYLWVAFRTHFTQGAIHLGRWAGYTASQEKTRKHRGGGAQQHRVTRERGMFALYYFVYANDGSGWSWRPFGLALLIILSLIWFPILGVSICLLIVAMVVNAGFKLNTPVALFLGPSTPDAIKLFWRVRFSTGIPWASLLRDPVEQPDEIGNSLEDIVDAMPNYISSNPWSLRLESNSDWLNVVNDFIDASTVIVIKAADVPAVLNELDLLANSYFPERIMVIVDTSFPISLVPARLRPAVMTEEEAIELLSLIACKPGEFRNRIQERAGLFETTGPF